MRSVVITRITRIALRILLILASVAVLVVALVMGWLFFYTSDLPNVHILSSFAPEAPTAIPEADICGEKVQVVAVPTNQMRDLRNALLAAEGDIDPSNALTHLYHDSFSEAGGKRYGSYSFQVSRQLFCEDHRGALNR